MTIKLFALTSPEGNRIPLTVLCSNCFIGKPANQDGVIKMAENCNWNGSLIFNVTDGGTCTVCGATNPVIAEADPELERLLFEEEVIEAQGNKPELRRLLNVALDMVEEAGNEVNKAKEAMEKARKKLNWTAGQARILQDECMRF